MLFDWHNDRPIKKAGKKIGGFKISEKEHKSVNMFVKLLSRMWPAPSKYTSRKAT